MNRLAVIVAVVGLLIGTLVGYLMWGQPGRGELATMSERLAEQAQKAETLESRLAESESKLTQATEDLAAERRLRQQYEEVLTRGRK